MRRLYLLVLMLCCLLVSVVANAAQVTDVKWGVDKDNMLRFVVDLTDAAPYKVEVTDKLMTITVDAPLQNGAAKNSKTSSNVAGVMKVEPAGEKTLIKIPLSRKLEANEYKSFTLRKDPDTKRPARIVMDITAEKRVAPTKEGTAQSKPSIANAKPASGTGTVVGNKPTTNTRKKPPEASVTLKGNVAAPSVSVAIGGGSVDSPKDKKALEKERKRKEKEEKKKAKERKKKGIKVTKPPGTFLTDGGIEGKIITIDPGHGGSDPGAVGNKGTLEKNITLEISKRLKEF